MFLGWVVGIIGVGIWDYWWNKVLEEFLRDRVKSREEFLLVERGNFFYRD